MTTEHDREKILAHDMAGLGLPLNEISLTVRNTPMNRIAFKMKLKPGFAKEYERRHSLLWPELKLLLEDAGIYDYSIFLDSETNVLFAVQKVKTESGSQDLAHHEVVQKWWKYMADIMVVHSDNSPVSIPLKEVFRLE